MFAAQHADRLRGLVYLDGATDPTLIRPVGSPMPISQRCRAESPNDARGAGPFPKRWTRSRWIP